MWGCGWFVHSTEWPAVVNIKGADIYQVFSPGALSVLCELPPAAPRSAMGHVLIGPTSQKQKESLYVSLAVAPRQPGFRAPQPHGGHLPLLPDPHWNHGALGHTDLD